MLPRSFLLRAAAFLLETFQLNNDCSGFWGCFPSLNSAAGKCFGRTNALKGMIRQLRSRRRPQYFWIPPRPHTPGPRGLIIATARIDKNWQLLLFLQLVFPNVLPRARTSLTFGTFEVNLSSGILPEHLQALSHYNISTDDRFQM